MKYPSRDLTYIINNFKYTNGIALDIGCGDGADSQFLISKGFEVYAVDINDAIKSQQLLLNKKFHFAKQNIEGFEFESYDLINAQWVLPFVKKGRFEDIFYKCKKALNQKGYFLGQLFGMFDQWKIEEKDINFITKPKIMKMLFGLEHIKFAEVKLHGFTYDKQPKFWHYYEFILKKP